MLACRYCGKLLEWFRIFVVLLRTSLHSSLHCRVLSRTSQGINLLGDYRFNLDFMRLTYFQQLNMSHSIMLLYASHPSSTDDSATEPGVAATSAEFAADLLVFLVR